MSVVLETSLGDLTIDLLVDEAPKTCENFLKLCKLKHYNDSLFYRIEKGFVAMAGHARHVRSPANAGPGPTYWGLIDEEELSADERKLMDYIPDEINKLRKHDSVGLIGTANETYGENGSTFYITLSPELHSLDGIHTIFGFVVEGLDDVLPKFDKVLTDDRSAPLQPIRIRHTIIIDDPFPDSKALRRLIPPKSPDMLEDDVFRAIETVEEEVKLLEKISQNEARSRAIALELLGDIPDAEMKPPENVLFIEFQEKKACEDAYYKMQDALIDDRRIHVDFCQSVSTQYFAFKRHGNRATKQDAIDVSQMHHEHHQQNKRRKR